MLKKMMPLVMVMTLFAANPARAQDQPSPYLTEEEHAELIQMLDESMAMMMGLITGLSEEQWNFRQNPNRWSVGECAEHIVRSETALFEYAKTAMNNPPSEDWLERTQGKTDLIRKVMPNRRPMGQGGASAPMEIRPTEKWDRGKTIAAYYKIRGEVRAYVETLDRPVKNQLEKHPFPVFSWLSAHDWLIYVPLHTVRHSRQIIEVQEDPNYPEK